MIDALIATEDVRFYEHSGIDVRGLFRVAKGMATGNSAAGGGSTITQQLAKMLFPREANQSFVELAVRPGMGDCREVGKELHERGNHHHVSQ